MSKGKPLFDHFRAIAPHYDRLAGQRDPGRMIALAGLPVSGALLDAGGGTGRVAHALRNYVGSAVVADESAEMLAQAAQKPGLEAVHSHVERLPFADGTFERIIMVDAFHHLADQPRSAAEMWRVLAPGGRLVIEEPDIRTFAVKLIALGEKLALMRSRILAAEQIAALFTNQTRPFARVRIERQTMNVWVIVDKE